MTDEQIAEAIVCARAVIAAGVVPYVDTPHGIRCVACAGEASSGRLEHRPGCAWSALIEALAATYPTETAGAIARDLAACDPVAAWSVSRADDGCPLCRTRRDGPDGEVEHKPECPWLRAKKLTEGGR